MKFENFADLAEQLITKLEKELTAPKPIVLGIGELGSSIGELIANKLDFEFAAVAVHRGFDEAGFQVEPSIKLPSITNSNLLICDLGAVTGTTALAVATELDQLAMNFHKVFAAGIIPREVEPILNLKYDQLISVSRPLLKRDLRWEFKQFQ